MDGRGNVDPAAPGCLSHPTHTPLRLEAGHGDNGGIRLYGALHLALVLLQHEGGSPIGPSCSSGLDQALMEAVRDELLFKRVARDEHRQGLIWRDEATAVRASLATGAPLTDWKRRPLGSHLYTSR